MDEHEHTKLAAHTGGTQANTDKYTPDITFFPESIVDNLPGHDEAFILLIYDHVNTYSSCKETVGCVLFLNEGKKCTEISLMFNPMCLMDLIGS